MDPVKPILDKLTKIFSRMDQAYQQTEQHYEFNCTGCEDNCCRTLFHHHTYIEYLYLRYGFKKLSQAQQQQIKIQAAETCRLTDQAISDGNPVRIMCPLNDADRCVLYAYRPMICRLHGVPHQFRRPNGQLQTGSGCGDFEQRCALRTQTLPDAPLDRTAVYQSMAELEQQARSRLNLTQKIRTTIAQMILDDDLLNQNPGDTLR